MSVQTLDRLLSVEAYLASATRVPEVVRIARLESQLRELWWSTWRTRARRAAAEASTATTAAALIRAVDRHMTAWAREIEPTTRRIVADIYRLSREVSWRKATGRVKGSLQYDTDHMQAVPIEKADFRGLATSFNVEDLDAIEALERDAMFWTGTHYDQNVRGALRGTAREIMVESGQDRARAGRDIQERIARELGHVTTPSGWRGAAAAYFESLAANTATVGRVTGTLTSFRRAGITRYEVVNPRDERTCPVCGHMDGKVFTTGQGEAITANVSAARTPDEVRAAHPWLRPPALRAISPRPGAQGGADARGLAAAGFALPPFHFRCRCTIDVSEDAMLDPGPPIDDALFARGSAERASIPRGRGTGGEGVRAPQSVVSPAHKPAWAGYPSPSASNAAPSGAFDAKKMSKALASVDEVGVRRELNNIVDEVGLVNHDFFQGASRAAGRRRYVVDPDDLPTGAEASNNMLGRIAANQETHDGATRFLAKATGRGVDITDGEDIVDAWSFKVLVHEQVHSTSPIIPTAPNGAALWVEEATTELAARRITANKFGIPMEILDGSETYQPVIDTLIGTVAKAAKVGEDVARDLVETAAFEMRKSTKIFATPDTYIGHFVKSIPDAKLGVTGSARAALNRKLKKDVKTAFDGFEY